MTSIARHTGAYVAAATFMTGGTVVAGIVVAAEDRAAAVFASITCKESGDLESQWQVTHKTTMKHYLRAVIPGGQVHV